MAALGGLSRLPGLDNIGVPVQKSLKFTVFVMQGYTKTAVGFGKHCACSTRSANLSRVRALSLWTLSAAWRAAVHRGPSPFSLRIVKRGGKSLVTESFA